MSILSIASNASAWRGYEYYKGKRVLSWKQTVENEFEGEVASSENEPYQPYQEMTIEEVLSSAKAQKKDGRTVIQSEETGRLQKLLRPMEGKLYLTCLATGAVRI